MKFFQRIMNPVLLGFEDAIDVTRQCMELFSNRMQEFSAGKLKFLKNRPVSSLLVGLGGMHGGLTTALFLSKTFGIAGMIAAPLAFPAGFAIGIGFMATAMAGSVATGIFIGGSIAHAVIGVFPSLRKDKNGKVMPVDRVKHYDNDVIRLVDNKLSTKHVLSKVFGKTSKPAAKANPANPSIPQLKM